MTNDANARIPILKRLYLAMFVLLPIVDQYEIGSLTFLQIYTIIGMLIWLIGYHEHKVNARVAVYIVYVMLISFIGSVIVKDNSISRNIFRMLSFSLLTLNMYSIFPSLCEDAYIFKLYNVIIHVVTIILFIQYILYFVLKQPTMFLLPGVTLNYNGGVNSSEFMRYTLGRIYTGYYYRPCSAFIEPGMQSMYTIPWIAIKLFRSNEINEKDLVDIIIITAGMVLTTSSMGIICAAVLWSVFIIKQLALRNRKYVMRVLFIIPVIVVAVILLLNQSGVSTSITVKTNSLRNLTTDSSTSSFALRVLRGWECFKKIGLFHNVFGCGYGNNSTYFTAINLSTKYDIGLQLIDYMSGIFYMLCSIGIAGGILLLSILNSLIPKTFRTMSTKMLLVCFGIIMCTASVFDKPLFFLYIGLLVSSLSIPDNEQE